WDEEGADWIRCGPTKCALKRIEKSNKITKEHLNNDPNGRYMIVMNFYKENLYSHIKHYTKYLLWRDIVNMLHKIAIGLKQIHDENLYHGNLHGGNLLIEYTIEGIHVKISDIGLHGQTYRNS
ncbi:21593_t:CDS:2, partial [Gigaspora margarita]